MPIIIARSIVALIGACFVFFNFTFHDVKTMQINVDGYFDTDDYIIFYTETKVKDETIPTEVIIDKEKNRGKIKITWKNKETELNIEGDITPENREYIEKTINAITDYIENSQTISQRTKGFIRNYIKNIRTSIGKRIIGN